jgi:hypothetical protein
MMKVMPLSLMQGKEKEEISTNHSKEDSLEQILSIKIMIFQRFNASNVRSLATIPDISLYGRIESNIPPPLMLTKSHPRNGHKMETRMMRSSSLFHPS